MGKKEQKAELVTGLAVFFESRDDILFAYLFGSTAREEKHAQSDIDIAVFLAGDDKSRHLVTDDALLAALPPVIKTDLFDLVILNYTPVVLAFEIISSGEQIFSRDEQARIDFEIMTRSRYWDLKPHLDEYRRLLIEKMRRVG